MQGKKSRKEKEVGKIYQYNFLLTFMLHLSFFFFFLLAVLLFFSTPFDKGKNSKWKSMRNEWFFLPNVPHWKKLRGKEHAVKGVDVDRIMCYIGYSFTISILN